MSDRDHAVDMLLAAERDLRALLGMLDGATFATEIFGFTAQQAVKKSLKAWLSANGAKYPRTHDTGALIAMLEELGEDVNDLWDLDDLTPFAGEARYTSRPVEEEPFERRGVADRADLLLARVRAQVGNSQELNP